jgi:cell division protein FtsN
MHQHRSLRPIGSQQGTLLLGLMIGMLCGLAVAVVVAVFVTRAPLPFVNKVPRGGERSAEILSGSEVPDPNRALAARASVAPAVVPGVSSPAPTPAASSQTTALPGTETTAPVASPERGLYVLQTGAFRSSDDADNMRAKLALIGFEARISATEVGSERLYRVRIGPYSQQDDVNLARFRLAENGIEATVVRQR